MKMFSGKQLISFVTFVSLAALVRAQNEKPAAPTPSGRLASVPGAKTATGIMASSVDGMSRYLAPDGPIQPALTAIGSLPVRGVELANNGITYLSSSLNQGARSLSRSAGNDGTIGMPGMAALESSMPASFAQLGNMMHGAIQTKNKFIMGQAERGIQAGERLRKSMQQGLEGVMRVKRSGGSGYGGNNQGMMDAASNMMSQASESMMKGGQQIKSQLKEHVEGALERVKSVRGMGDNMRSSAQGTFMTLSSGLMGAMSQLQQTSQQVKQQLQGDLQKNMGAMSNIMGSMQGSMGMSGQHMQKNFEGVMKSAQKAAEHLTSSLQQVASKPMELMSKLGDKMGSMMMGGGGSHQASKGGRY